MPTSVGSDSSKLFEDTKIASDLIMKNTETNTMLFHLDISSFFDDYKDNLIEKDCGIYL